MLRGRIAPLLCVDIVENIRNTIEHHRLIPEESGVVVAVSGGADSVALLRALHQLGYAVTAAHLNHQLRGAESDADEAFVAELAGELGVPVKTKSVDVSALAERKKHSIEMTARQARHDFFAEFGEVPIALAHHADDQVETFILKLARGAGSDGLGGMPFAQQIGPINLIRPMLGISRDDILGWLKNKDFAWREDASNNDETYLRNRVRHMILPMMERELNPGIRENILRTMDILREENAWMNQMQDHPTSLAARRRSLRKWLFDHGAEEAGFEVVDRILALMDRGCGSSIIELNNRQRVVVEYGNPRFEDGPAAAGMTEWELTVEPGTGWTKDHGKGVGILPADASFSAEKVGSSPLTIRGFEPGDRIEPLGMQGSRKLQDIFTDQKIPKARRRHIPVVLCRNEIIWVPGYRIARGWAVEKGEKSIHVRIERSGTN